MPSNDAKKPRVPLQYSHDDHVHPPSSCYNLRQQPQSNNVTKDFYTNNAQDIMNNAFKFLPNNTLTPPPNNDPYKYEMKSSVPSLVNTIFDPQTGKLMMYRKLTKNRHESHMGEIVCKRVRVLSKQSQQLHTFQNQHYFLHSIQPNA